MYWLAFWGKCVGYFGGRLAADRGMQTANVEPASDRD
jgi:hypothetical protein